MDAAREAEALGFSTVWAADRIVIPWEITTPYAYSWSDSFIVPPEKPFLESLTVLAFLAGCTESLRLGVSVLVMPYRDPVSWAKVAATIDWLSNGRFVLGVGVGWMAEEFAALGREDLFSRRGQVGDEHLEILANLLAEDHCSFDGSDYAYRDIAFYPKGHDRARPMPVWCGGEGAPARRRAGRYGDAWFPYLTRVTPEALAADHEDVRRHAEAAGRDPDEVSLSCCLSVEVTEEDVPEEPDLARGSPDQLASRLAALEAVGVDHVALQFLVGRYPERLDQMRRLSAALPRPEPRG